MEFRAKYSIIRLLFFAILSFLLSCSNRLSYHLPVIVEIDTPKSVNDFEFHEYMKDILDRSNKKNSNDHNHVNLKYKISVSDDAQITALTSDIIRKKIIVAVEYELTKEDVIITSGVVKSSDSVNISSDMLVSETASDAIENALKKLAAEELFAELILFYSAK